AHTNEFFGTALAAGDFNGDGFDDLAIGIAGKVVNMHNNAGAVSVLYGSASGITSAKDQLWTQDSPGINGIADASDQFGGALAAGDFNGDGRDDLAISASNETTSVVATGGVNVIYGTSSGLNAKNDQFWTQDSPGINDSSELEDA